MSGGAVMEATALINAKDNTGPAFDRIAARLRTVVRLMGMMNQVSTMKALETNISSAVTQADRLQTAMSGIARAERMIGEAPGVSRLASQIDRATAATGRLDTNLDRAHARAKGLGTVMGNLGMLAGPMILHETGQAVKAGATLEERKAALAAAGAKPEDIERASREFREFSKTHSGVLEADYLAGYQDSRVIAPASKEHPDHPYEMARYAALYRAGLRNSALPFNDHDVGDALRVMDEMALKTDEQRVSFIDEILKSQQTFRDQVPVSTILAAIRNSKQSVYAMDPKFINDYLPTILQSAGQNGGTEIMTAYNNYIGQHMQHAELVKLAAAGFANPKDLIYDKNGKVKQVREGAKFFEEDKFKSNIAEWAWDFHSKFMSRKGATEEGFDKLVASMPRNMAALIAFLVHNEDRMKRDAETREGAEGLKASSDRALARNPVAGLHALTESIEQFGAAVSNPIMGKAGEMLVSVAHGIQEAANAYQEFAKSHPELAKGIGVSTLIAGTAIGGHATYQLFEGLLGGNLKGSARDLTHAAHQLSAAAGHLNGKGGPGGPGGPNGSSLLGKLWWLVPTAAAAAFDMAQLDTPEKLDARMKANAKNDVDWDTWLKTNVPALNIFDPEWRKAHWGWGGASDFLPEGKKPALDIADYERARRAQAEILQDPEGARGRHMMERDHAEDLARSIATSINGQAQVTVIVQPSADFMTRVQSMVKSGMEAFSLKGSESVGSTGATHHGRGDL